MKRTLLALSLLGAQVACAYEFKLQFTPPGGAYLLAVAGYQFSSNTVVGDCSYYTVTSTGGRGAHYIKKYYYNSCTWDLFGNLVSLAPVSSEPVAPSVISTTGTEVVYAISGTSSTGRDTRGFGFVGTPSSHYSWQSVNGGYAVIPDAGYSITATLISDGDFPLSFVGATVTSSVSGTFTPTPGTATISATTCTASVTVGSTCSVTTYYNPTSIKCTGSPYGYAYTNIDMKLITDAGANLDFTEGFTITGVPICGD